jgi:hypothetical protein
MYIHHFHCILVSQQLPETLPLQYDPSSEKPVTELLHQGQGTFAYAVLLGKTTFRQRARVDRIHHTYGRFHSGASQHNILAGIDVQVLAMVSMNLCEAKLPPNQHRVAASF